MLGALGRLKRRISQHEPFCRVGGNVWACLGACIVAGSWDALMLDAGVFWP